MNIKLSNILVKPYFLEPKRAINDIINKVKNLSDTRLILN